MFQDAQFSHFFALDKELAPQKISAADTGINNSGTHIKQYEYLGPFEGGTKTVYYFAMNIESSIPMPEYLLRSVNDTVYTGQTACIRQAAESFNSAPIRTGTLPLQKDP